MDMTLNHDSWPHRAPSRRDGTPPPASFDWQGLAARLSAAYALRRALSGKDILGEAPSGSFDESAAGAIAGFGGDAGGTPFASLREASQNAWEAGVNPIALGDLKAAGGIDTEVAGHTRTSDRGLK